MDPKCHICGNPTDEDYICQRCGEYVCEDCWVPMTYHNQCTETRCQSCEDLREEEEWKEIEREERQKEALIEKKKIEKQIALQLAKEKAEQEKIAKEKALQLEKLKNELDIVLD